MKKQIVATGVFLFSFILPLKAIATSFDQIYVFGDSLSDDGNLYEATGVPPSPPYYQGHFSNGPVWVQYLAQDLGLTSNRETNFAFAGATTGSDNPFLPGVQGLLGLQQEIEGFTAANKLADPNALYIVQAGINDYYIDGVTDPTVPVNNLSKAVMSLAAVGAKNIMVVNVPDWGNFPALRGDSQASSSLNTLIGAHNSDLASTLNFLRQKLNIKIVLLDVNSLFKRIFADPERFGFTNVTDPCLTNFINGSPAATYLQGLLSSVDHQICANPDKYLFWDENHPTTAGHKLMAELAYSELKAEPVPEPFDWLKIRQIFLQRRIFPKSKITTIKPVPSHKGL